MTTETIARLGELYREWSAIQGHDLKADARKHVIAIEIIGSVPAIAERLARLDRMEAAGNRLIASHASYFHWVAALDEWKEACRE